MLSTTNSQSMGWLPPPVQQENFSRPMMRDEISRDVALQAPDAEAIADQAWMPESREVHETVRQVERLAGRYEAAERARQALQASNFELTRRLAHNEEALRKAVSRIGDLQSQLYFSQKAVTIAQNNCAIATALAQSNNALQISLAAPDTRIIRPVDRPPLSLPMPTEIDRSLSSLLNESSLPGTQRLSIPDATRHDHSKKARHCFSDTTLGM